MLYNFLILIYLGAVWVGAFSLIKYDLRTLGPITEMASRAIIAFMGLLVLSLILKKDLRAGIKNWFGYLVFALLGVVLLWLADSFGLEYISAGLGSVLVVVTPLTTFIIAALILRDEKITVSNVSGLIIGLIGLVLVIGIENIVADSTMIFGVLIVAGGFVLFGINGVLAPRLVKDGDPIVATTYYMGIGALILVVLAFIFESPTQMKWGPVNIGVELVLGIVPTASGFLGFYYLIKKAGPFFASTTFYLMPVFGMLASIFFLGQKTDMSQIVGIGVVILGLYLINRKQLEKS
ncbi:MAG: permease [Thermodesulfobacteriota bacterium]|nr:MAG: permease [Thermodesulfobacteriota bacterium]